jgi:uncharacterized protein YoxC
MNYNNKRKPSQAKPSENIMMFKQSDHRLQESRFGGLDLWSPLRRVLLVVAVTASLPTMVSAGPAEGGTPRTQSQNQPNIPVVAQNDTDTGERAPSQNTNRTNEPSETKIPADSSPQSSEASPPATASNMMLWITMAILFLVLLVIVFWLHKMMSDNLEQLNQSINGLKNDLARANLKSTPSKIKQESYDQKNDSFNQRQDLTERVNLLEEQIRQLGKQPASAKSDPYSFDDAPILESELIVSKPLVSIEKEDLIALQHAFVEWRSNSRAKKLVDCLSNDFLQKIKTLDYAIVFAKAGIGLNKMIIDRKPPNNTCMIGLSKPHHSLMFCYDKTSQTDDMWRPNTWYEVSIDAPDSADEQTVHQLEELLP